MHCSNPWCEEKEIELKWDEEKIEWRRLNAKNLTVESFSR
jgi:hypothetical protein